MFENANFQVALKVILKNNHGEILILESLDSSQMVGYHDFPGGRIQESEITLPFGEIIKREIEEELGPQIKYRLKPSPVALGRHFYFLDVLKNKNKQHVLWVFFEADYLGGKIRISKEHKGYRWVKLSKNNLKKYFIRGPLEGMWNYLSKKSKK